MNSPQTNNQERIHTMNPPTQRKVRLSGIDPSVNKYVTIGKDSRTPGRIFATFPRYASMTRQEAINLATALADSLDD